MFFKVYFGTFSKIIMRDFIGAMKKVIYYTKLFFLAGQENWKV